MAIRPGDSCTISLNPTIKIADYTMLKPFASITRTVQSDADLPELEADVRRLIARAAASELEVLVGALNALADTCDTEALMAHLRQEIDNAPAQIQSTPPATAAGPARRPAQASK